MSESVKKLISYLLIATVLLITLIGLLGVWDIIELRNLGTKLWQSAFIICMAAVLSVVIFSMLGKDKPKSN